MSILRVLKTQSSHLGLFRQNKFKLQLVLLSQQLLERSPRIIGPVIESEVLRGVSAVEQLQMD